MIFAMQKTLRVEMSTKTLFLALLIIGGLFLVWFMRDIVFSLFIAFIIASVVKPIATRLEKKHIPKRITASVVALLLLSLVIGAIVWMVPLFLHETAILSKQLPNMIEEIYPPAMSYIDISSFSSYLPNLTNQAIDIVQSFFSNAIFITTTLFFSIYFVTEEAFLVRSLNRYLGEKKTTMFMEAKEKIEKRMASWMVGELVLMLLIGVMTYAGLLLMGVKYALPLAIIAGALEIVPNIGPIIATIPALIVALTQNYLLLVFVLALYIIVQQLENNLIVPLVMKKAIGMNPLISLISLLIGGRFAGPIGILLAIPTALMIESIFLNLTPSNNEKDR